MTVNPPSVWTIGQEDGNGNKAAVDGGRKNNFSHLNKKDNPKTINTSSSVRYI